jgi:hypothetical protein
MLKAVCLLLAVAVVSGLSLTVASAGPVRKPDPQVVGKTVLLAERTKTSGCTLATDVRLTPTGASHEARSRFKNRVPSRKPRTAASESRRQKGYVLSPSRLELEVCA